MSLTLMLIALAITVVAGLTGWLTSKHIGRNRVKDAEATAQRIIADAKKEAENLKKEKQLEAKDEWLRLKQNF